MGNVVPMPGFYEEYEDDAACLGRPHAQRLKNRQYVPFVPCPRGPGTSPTILALGLKWPPSLEDSDAHDDDSSRFTSATVHKRWTVQQLQDALTAVEEVQSMGDADANVTEELKIQQSKIEEQLHLSMTQLESICQSFETTNYPPAVDIQRRDSFEEAEEVSKALAKGPGGVDGARAPGESGIAWEKRLQQSMRKVVDRLAERERRVVQLKMELKTERSKNAINERSLREVKSQLEQVQRRVLEVSPVVVASASTNTEELRRLQDEVNNLREDLSSVTSERDQAKVLLERATLAAATGEEGDEHQEDTEEDSEIAGAAETGVGSRALAAPGQVAPKTWNEAWDALVASSLPAPVAHALSGQLSTLAVGGTAGSALLLALAVAYKRKGRRGFTEYFRQLGLMT